MSWYLARRIMECRVAGKLRDFQEDFFLVQASNDGAAAEGAQGLSKGEEASYENKFGQQVVWTLAQLGEISRLDIEDFADTTWLYTRAFPGISTLSVRSGQRIQLTDHDIEVPKETGQWYGAMLLFLASGKRPHEEERLLLLRAPDPESAGRRAVAVALGEAAQSEADRLLGLFQVHELLGNRIEPGTEVYCRFYRPSQLRNPGAPPREEHLTTVEMGGEVRRSPISA
jgi:hypothetical protein